MLNAARINEELRQKLWAERANHATQLKILDSDVNQNVFDDDNLNINYLRKFGEMAIVKRTNKIQSKLSNKEVTCMCLGRCCKIKKY